MCNTTSTHLNSVPITASLTKIIKKTRNSEGKNKASLKKTSEVTPVNTLRAKTK